MVTVGVDCCLRRVVLFVGFFCGFVIVVGCWCIGFWF